jgi:hypothetical protein
VARFADLAEFAPTLDAAAERLSISLCVPRMSSIAGGLIHEYRMVA